MSSRMCRFAHGPGLTPTTYSARAAKCAVYMSAVSTLCFTCLQIISWGSNWENRWKYRHLPGPAYSFPLGNLATIRKKMVFRAYTDWQAQYGDMFKIFFVRQPVLITTGQPVHQHISNETNSMSALPWGNDYHKMRTVCGCRSCCGPPGHRQGLQQIS